MSRENHEWAAITAEPFRELRGTGQAAGLLRAVAVHPIEAR